PVTVTSEPPAGSEAMVAGETVSCVGLFVHVVSPGYTVSVTVQLERFAMPLLCTVTLKLDVAVCPHPATVGVHCLTTVRPGVRHWNLARSKTGVMLTPGTLLQPQFRVAVSGSALARVVLHATVTSGGLAVPPAAIVPTVMELAEMPVFDSVTVQLLSGAVPVLLAL